MGTCFKFYFPNLYDFYLIAVLICYLYFIVYHKAYNVFGRLAGFFSGQVCCWWPRTWQEMKAGLFQEHYALLDAVLEYFQLLRSIV